MNFAITFQDTEKKSKWGSLQMEMYWRLYLSKSCLSYLINSSWNTAQAYQALSKHMFFLEHCAFWTITNASFHKNWLLWYLRETTKKPGTNLIRFLMDSLQCPRHFSVFLYCLSYMFEYMFQSVAYFTTTFLFITIMTNQDKRLTVIMICILMIIDTRF